jgi:hypothetical protein
MNTLPSAVQTFAKEVRQRNLVSPDDGGTTPWYGLSPDRPMAFQFRWREQRFRGSITATSHGCRMALTTLLPSRAEVGPDGGWLVAVIDIEQGQSRSAIKLLAGQHVVLDDRVDLPAAALAVDGLVSGLTLVVLATAPYLDLLTTGLAPVTARPPLPVAV